MENGKLHEKVEKWEIKWNLENETQNRKWKLEKETQNGMASIGHGKFVYSHGNYAGTCLTRVFACSAPSRRGAFRLYTLIYSVL